MDIKETNPSANVPKQPDAPLGDRGKEKTWESPQGEQGISNREGDEDFDEGEPKKKRSHMVGAAQCPIINIFSFAFFDASFGLVVAAPSHLLPLNRRSPFFIRLKSVAPCESI